MDWDRYWEKHKRLVEKEVREASAWFNRNAWKCEESTCEIAEL